MHNNAKKKTTHLVLYCQPTITCKRNPVPSKSPAQIHNRRMDGTQPVNPKHIMHEYSANFNSIIYFHFYLIAGFGFWLHRPNANACHRDNRRLQPVCHAVIIGTKDRFVRRLSIQRAAKSTRRGGGQAETSSFITLVF